MMTNKRSAEKTVRDIRRATHRHYSAEEKIRIVLEGLRGRTVLPNCVDGKALTAIQQAYFKMIGWGWYYLLDGTG